MEKALAELKKVAKASANTQVAFGLERESKAGRAFWS
jgi:hypothetical protein